MKQFKSKEQIKAELHETVTEMIEEDYFTRHYNTIDQTIYSLVADRLNYTENAKDKNDEVVIELKNRHIRVLLNDLLALQMLREQLRALEQYGLSIE